MHTFPDLVQKLEKFTGLESHVIAPMEVSSSAQPKMRFQTVYHIGWTFNIGIPVDIVHLAASIMP